MADGAPLLFNKVTALPEVLQPDAIYFVQDAPGRMSIVVTSATAEAHELNIPRDALQLSFGSKSKPSAGAEFGRYLATEALDLQETLSAAVAEVAATAQSDVLVTRGAETAARFRWNAAASAAQVLILIPAIDPGDLLIFTAPEVQDATLSGITGTLTGLRRIG